MKKLLLTLLIITSSTQISYPNEEIPTSNETPTFEAPTLREISLKKLMKRPDVIEKMKNIENEANFQEMKSIQQIAPDLFLKLINQNEMPENNFLIKAIKENNPQKTERFMNLYFDDINHYQKNYLNSFLHYAAAHNAYNTIPLLIDTGADINKQDINGNTPLHKAAANNAKESVPLLLNAGADANKQNKKLNTPLHQAAINDACSTIYPLITLGRAHIDAKNKNRRTPLLEAADANAQGSMNLLITLGADKKGLRL
ncbi:MAG: ankyrin repeat domain-containing protein [Candidatus Dependentiae bacterium]|nr:ankyrin repeat domain-containing protein [Candidatus Dependentiae bacterium]